jgi:hypothetical protein
MASVAATRTESSAVHEAIKSRCRMCGSISLEIALDPTPDSIVICSDCGAGEKYRDFELRLRSGLRMTVPRTAGCPRPEDDRP